MQLASLCRPSDSCENTKYVNTVRQIKLLLLVLLPFIYLGSILQSVAKTTLSLATTSCGRLERKTHCILVCPGHAWNSSPGKFLGIIMTICSNSSLIISLFYMLDCRLGCSSALISAQPTAVQSTSQRPPWSVCQSPSPLTHQQTPEKLEQSIRCQPRTVTSHLEMLILMPEERAALKNTEHNLIHTAWRLHCHSNPELCDELTTRNSSSKNVFNYTPSLGFIN